MVKLWR